MQRAEGAPEINAGESLNQPLARGYLNTLQNTRVARYLTQKHTDSCMRSCRGGGGTSGRPLTRMRALCAPTASA
jgi:hypothetical protein